MHLGMLFVMVIQIHFGAPRNLAKMLSGTRTPTHILAIKFTKKLALTDLPSPRKKLASSVHFYLQKQLQIPI
jgi:hypothetical protein